ncbi:hypothetical protein FYM19_10880 [Staphylococcus aureus]|nr:hypothetical protein FYM19_10880 [Staphylococcus aureus]
MIIVPVKRIKIVIIPLKIQDFLNLSARGYMSKCFLITFKTLFHNNVKSLECIMITINKNR